eukprot:jgi/Chlat1/1946/Chrsp157S02258
MAAGQGVVDECALEFEGSQYDIGLHVGGLFIILAASLLGCLIPVLGARWPSLRLPRWLFDYGRNFGTGVILATAFVHMLEPSFSALSSPCLSSLWNQTYTAFAGVFALTAALAVQLVEFLLTMKLEQLDRETQRSSEMAMKDLAIDVAETPLNAHETQTEKPSTYGPVPHQHSHHGVDSHSLRHDAEHGKPGVGAITLRRRQSVTLVLEAGIAFHSVIIGIALGVSTAEFKTLLAALCVHQFFEGFALGATVIDAKFDSVTQILSMVIGYALTTPIGVAIGIAARTSYNENSRTALIVQGTFDAVSAGILIYTGLVELLTYNVTLNPEFRASSAKNKLGGFLSLYLGAGIMALIGRWA